MLTLVIGKEKKTRSRQNYSHFPFNCLPYRIHSTGEVFQQDIEEIIEGCERTRNRRDDIIILGSTINQLEIRTEQVLNRISKSDL